MSIVDDVITEDVVDLTESLGSRSKLICSPVGFYLHSVKVGRGHAHALVKVYSGIPPELFSPAEQRVIIEEFKRELALWKLHCSTKHFGTLLGRCDSVDSVVPCPTYKEIKIARDYVQGSQHTNPHYRNLLNFFLGIAEGLEYLHSKGLTHGDIRADNILVGFDESPLIADFGLSRIREILDRMKKTPDADISASRWMPAEIIGLDDSALYKPTIPGDIWSFGMTMFELWSGKLPYHDTRPERISVKIIQGTLPSFPPPGAVKREFEGIREPVMFLCNLCWKENPKERKTMAELVHILRELIEGKPIRAIREEFDAKENTERPGQQRSPFARGNGFPLEANPFSISDASSFSETGSFDPKETTSYIGGSSSSTSDFGGSDKTTKGFKQPKTEIRDDVSVSSWSHTGNKGQDENRNKSNPHRADFPPPPTNTSPPSTSRMPKPINGGPQRYSTLPPPPSPDSPWNEVDSYKTALLNYMAGRRKGAQFELRTTSEGDHHLPRWISVSLIDGMEYGRSTNRIKKKAEDEAARQTLERLSTEDPLFASASPSYLSKFKSYLAQYDLTNRVEWIYESEGVDHMKTWTCEIRRDGVDLAKGAASKKQDAAEQAARKVAAIWTRRI